MTKSCGRGNLLSSFFKKFENMIHLTEYKSGPNGSFGFENQDRFCRMKKCTIWDISLYETRPLSPQ
jgi:hypothetical protein